MTKFETNKVQWKMDSLVGPIYLVSSQKGLQSVLLEEQDIPFAAYLDSEEPEIKILKSAVKELEEYFRGERKSFSVPLDTEGTSFQKRVWNALLQIPYGKTCSYQDIALKIKNTKAMRAVGNANGKNPLCIIVPCHRVIASNGALGGYSGGIEVKKKLLALEQKESL